MSESVSLSRRWALKLLAGAPMLPLASTLAGLPLLSEAASPRRPSRPGAAASYRFNAMAAPSLANPAQMATTYVASTLTKRAGRHHASAQDSEPTTSARLISR